MTGEKKAALRAARKAGTSAVRMVGCWASLKAVWTAVRTGLSWEESLAQSWAALMAVRMAGQMAENWEHYLVATWDAALAAYSDCL